MKMNIFEKKALYSFGCPNYHATVDRLHLIAALAPDYETKKLLFNLVQNLFIPAGNNGNSCILRICSHSGRKAVNIVPSAAEKTGNPACHTRVIFH